MIFEKPTFFQSFLADIGPRMRENLTIEALMNAPPNHTLHAPVPSARQQTTQLKSDQLSVVQPLSRNQDFKKLRGWLGPFQRLRDEQRKISNI